jgi:hypothetical protein
MMLQLTSEICPVPSAKKENAEHDCGLVRNLVALLILAIMVAWFTADLLTGGKVPFYRDLGTYFYPAKLVLADSFYPGWRVYVNGQEREILKANVFFRGVDLPAGTHIVEFLYRPRSFALGLTVSLATLGAVLLVSVAGRFRKESA